MRPALADVNRNVLVALLVVLAVGLAFAWCCSGSTAGTVQHDAVVRAPDAVPMSASTQAATLARTELQPAPAHAEALPAGTESIAGIVVDDAGQPVAGASFLREERGRVLTGSDGRFTIVRTTGDAGSIAIGMVVPHPSDVGFESLLVDRWVDWGTRDLRFELGRKVRLEVELVDAQNRPVRASAMLTPSWWTSWPIEERRVEGEGLLVFPHVGRGSCRLSFDDVPDGFVQPLPREFELRQSERIKITLTTPGSRPVHVVRSDGRPAVASRVRLLAAERLSDAALKNLAASPMFSWQPHLPDQVHDERTDDAGCAALRGGSGSRYVVFVTGHHAPAIVRGVVLDEPEPLEVHLVEGGRLDVRFAPPGALSRLQLASGWPI